MNRLRRASNGLLALGFALVLLLPSSAGAAEAVKVTYTKESVPSFEAQLGKGEVQSAVFNKKLRSLRVTLKNGEHVLVTYPKKQAPAFEAKIKAAHTPYTVLSDAQANQELKKKPKHHKIRYIAGGVLLIVIVIVGAVLIVNRRRQRD
jgi:hypothetical protein